MLLNDLSACGIEIKGRGSEARFKYCPYCETPEDTGFNYFSLNLEKEVFRCVKCNTSGHWSELKKHLGLVPECRPAVYRASCQKKPVKPPARPELTAGDMAAFYTDYQTRRGISPDVLKKYTVGRMEKDSKTFAVYQFFSKGEIVNRKYRNLADKKTQWQEPGAESTYYGLQHVKEGGLLHVVEGENDCHALAQLGLLNVVSVPSGAGTYTPAMDVVNKKFETIVLLFDNDEPGQTGARRFAEKAGLHKCHNVRLPYKDARECLLKGLTGKDLAAAIGGAERFTLDGVVKTGAFKEQLLEHFRNPERSRGLQIVVRGINRILGGIRQGELTSLTGHTGSGKSTFGLNVALWVVRAGWPVLVVSLENAMRQTVQKMIAIDSGESIFQYDEFDRGIKLVKTESWISNQIDKLDIMPLYFLDPESNKGGYYTLDKIIEAIDYAVKFHDIRFVLVDHLEYFISLKSSDTAVYVINSVMRQLKELTKRLQVHVLLIAHPAKTTDKEGKLAALGLNSFKGSSAIQQESDNIPICQRVQFDELKPAQEAKLKIIKNRENGHYGEVIFHVAENMNTFKEKTN